jgi:hypothetical protein
MWILRVEELEQRHLLSGCFPHSIAPARRDQNGGTAWMAPELNPDFHSPLGGSGRFDPGPRLGPAEGLFHPAPSALIQAPIIRIPSNDVDVPKPGSFGGGLESLSTVVTIRDSSIDRGGQSMGGARLGLSPIPAFVTALTALPSTFATTTVLSLQTKGRVEEGIVAGPIVPPANRPSSDSVNPDGGKKPDPVNIKPRSALHPPLAFLTSAVDVARLSRGFKQFLQGFERSVEQVSETDGLRTWIVVGVAAAVACELARRQLRRHSADTQQHLDAARATVISN